MGVISGSRISRIPLRQNVVDRPSLGSGPRLPASCTTSGMAKRPRAPPSVYLINGRRPGCDAVPPAAMVCTASRRAWSEDRCGCRASVTSASGIRVLAQWTAPTPMHSRLSTVFAHGLIDPVGSQFWFIQYFWAVSWSRKSLRGHRIRSRGLGAEPDGRTDQQPQAEDPDEHPLGDRSEVAQTQAARVLALVQVVQVADDVVLVRRGQVLVVEDRHRLRPGRHCLVDVIPGDVAQAPVSYTHLTLP